MAWEKRNGTLYYYRSRRVDGRVEKVYIGRGRPAELAARVAAGAELRRREQAAALEALEAELAPADRLFDGLDAAVRRLTEATLLGEGFWRRNYTWRRRRDVARAGGR